MSLDCHIPSHCTNQHLSPDQAASLMKTEGQRIINFIYRAKITINIQDKFLLFGDISYVFYCSILFTCSIVI